MIYQTDVALEFRGVETKTSSKGNEYMLLHFEDDNGAPVEYYCKSGTRDASSLVKGNKYFVLIELDRFKNINLIGILEEGK